METYKIASINEGTDYIKIKQVRAFDGKLVVGLDLSVNIKKYFFRNDFVVEYDKNIDNVDESILAIVPFYVVAPVAWAAGADIYVEKLDRTSLYSLQEVRRLFQTWYPKFSRSGATHVKNVVDNRFNNRQTALLFSGGIDSTASYIRHKDERPILFTCLRGETHSHEAEYYDRVKTTFLNFAKNEEVDIRFIRTDVWDTYSNLLNNPLLARDFEVADWWMKVSHTLIPLGLSAPLTVENIGTLYMASTFKKGYELRNGSGSHFLTLTDISWADVKIIHDGAELTRYEKIRHLLRENPDYCKNLRVCSPIMNPGYYKGSFAQPYTKNCGSCQKCVESIMELLLVGIDPSKCNFDLHTNVLDYGKNLFRTGVIDLADNTIELFQDIQRNIPDTIKDDDISRLYQTKKFFDWFKHFDLSAYEFHTSEKVRMLCWIYCLIKYRGIYNTFRLVIENAKRSPAASR